MEERKLSHGEKISRGEFFEIAAKKSKEVTLSWVDKFLAPMSKMSEELTESKEKGSWIEIAQVEEVTNIPKMVIKQGKGYFAFKGNENKIKVIYGMCPEDGFVMNYLNNDDGLYCANCQAIYYLIRDSKLEEGKQYADEVPTKVEHNQVFIFLEA